MNSVALFDPSSTDRELIRKLRAGVAFDDSGLMPESVAWHVFLELRRRGEPSASSLFMRTLRSLHARRVLGTAQLSTDDVSADEHRLMQGEDPFLADLWKAYKRCLQHNRTGPAEQLLRDIEEQVAQLPEACTA